MPNPSRRRRALALSAAATFVAAAAIAVTPVLADLRGDTRDDSPDDCAVDEILVNPCRAWLGARASDYTDADTSFLAQHEHHEERLGRQIDIGHTFAKEGELPLSDDDEVKLAEREDTYLFQNWKPAEKWADAGGGDEEVNKHIDAAADNISAVSGKIFLTIHHEPENDVASDSECETKGDASAGTAEEYVQMWHNVRERFDAKGVDNVVWVVDYMNYPTWDCLVPKMYPGDDHVDWIMFNGYGSGDNADFADNVKRFYDLLTDMSTDERDLLSKPWGIVEWGISESSQEAAEDYYRQAAEALDKELFPKLQAYMIFDSPGTHDDGGLRVGYDDSGNAAPDEQDSYTDFANHPALTDE